VKKYIVLDSFPCSPHVIFEKLLWIAGNKLKFKSIPIIMSFIFINIS
jgi:hypothetical protein